MTPQGRTAFTTWLRRTHGWFGLWGATLGLLFGFSGIWLNHRAVLKLPLAVERQNAQIALAGHPRCLPGDRARSRAQPRDYLIAD